MTVRIYRSDDASAPSLNNTAGSLISVLDACLVNGYGAKAAAGWTKTYSGTNKAVYRQGTGSNGFYLRVDDTGTTGARIRGFETMSDVDTGTGPVPTDAQFSGGLHASKSNSGTARPWVVVADQTQIFFWTGYDEGTSASISASITYYKPAWAFGDFESFVTGDAYNTQIIGGTSASDGSLYFGQVKTGNPTSTSISGHYIFRALSQTGGSIESAKHAFGVTSAGMGAQGIAYPAPQDSSMTLLPVYVTEALTSGTFTGVIRGKVKGLWSPYHNLPGAHGDTFDGKGNASGKSFILLQVSHGGGTNARCAIEYSDTW